jgi:uncharacterized protein (DUF736 family)
MAYEKRDNSGSLFKNKRKTRENDPTLAGSIMVNGQEFWINGWTKTKDDGEKWISLSVRPKEQQAQAPAASAPNIDTDIPF